MIGLDNEVNRKAIDGLGAATQTLTIKAKDPERAGSRRMSARGTHLP